MVNYGVSRACETCRRRRKKTCNRCAKAGRACLGYRSSDQLRFRHHKPPALPSPPTSEQSSRGPAVDAFLEQYVVHSADSSVSRGFLDGLPSLLANAEPSSHVAQATISVAWASLGNLWKRPDLLARAREQYLYTLHSFQGLMHSCQVSAPTVEALVTALLLGLYEIISSSEDQPAQEHVAHVRGVCALLLSPNSPFDLQSSMQLFQVANPLLLRQAFKDQPTPGVFCAPASNDTVHDLDAILIKCHPLFERANNQLQDPTTSLDDLQQTFAQALVIKREFSRWDAHKDAAWAPRTVGSISETDAESSSCPYVTPGPIHSYYDVYVGAVMNTYRKTYLMLLDVLIRLAPRSALEETKSPVAWVEQSSILINDMIASIPYHLAKDPKQYLISIVSRSGAPAVGRHVGGLLLLHPLYVLSTCSVVPASTQSYVRRCLAWIGEHMGIGQAKVMSQGYDNIPFQQMAEGHVLIWAGMLLQPDNKSKATSC
ncbi:hypothetical protein BDV18DRAFT_163974 [Aspergillus unguis]